MFDRIVGEGKAGLGLEETAEFLVGVLGMTDCHCGDPDCLVGKAIRDEVQRRRKGNGPTESGNLGAISAMELEQALKASAKDFGRQVGRGVYSALKSYDEYRRKNVLWRRLIRGIAKLVKIVLALVFFPLFFIRDFATHAFHWKKMEDLINKAQKIEKELNDDPIGKILFSTGGIPNGGFKTIIKNNLRLSARLGHRFGRWCSQKKAGITSGWANRPRWMSNKK